jgi:hypothetical protein
MCGRRSCWNVPSHLTGCLRQNARHVPPAGHCVRRRANWCRDRPSDRHRLSDWCCRRAPTSFQRRWHLNGCPSCPGYRRRCHRLERSRFGKSANCDQWTSWSDPGVQTNLPGRHWRRLRRAGQWNRHSARLPCRRRRRGPPQNGHPLMSPTHRYVVSPSRYCRLFVRQSQPCKSSIPDIQRIAKNASPAATPEMRPRPFGN